MFVAVALLGTTRGSEAEEMALGRAKAKERQLSQGSLQVYSATDAFDDGGLPYYAYSSYVIYTTDEKLFKNVENHMSNSDEAPDIVTLPLGTYVIEARSERDSYVRVRVVIKRGRLTVLDLDGEQTDVQERPAVATYSRRLASW